MTALGDVQPARARGSEWRLLSAPAIRSLVRQGRTRGPLRSLAGHIDLRKSDS